MKASRSRKARRAGAVDQMKAVRAVLGTLVVLGHPSSETFSDALRKKLADAARKDLARAFGLTFVSLDAKTLEKPRADVIAARCGCGRSWTQAQLDAGEIPENHACDHARAEEAKAVRG